MRQRGETEGEGAGETDRQTDRVCGCVGEKERERGGKESESERVCVGG